MVSGGLESLGSSARVQAVSIPLEGFDRSMTVLSRLPAKQRSHNTD